MWCLTLLLMFWTKLIDFFEFGHSDLFSRIGSSFGFRLICGLHFLFRFCRCKSRYLLFWFGKVVNFGLLERIEICKHLYCHLHHESTFSHDCNFQVSRVIDYLAFVVYHRLQESKEVFDQLNGCQSIALLLNFRYLCVVIWGCLQSFRSNLLDHFLPNFFSVTVHLQDSESVGDHTQGLHHFPLTLSSLI